MMLSSKFPCTGVPMFLICPEKSPSLSHSAGPTVRNWQENKLASYSKSILLWSLTGIVLESCWRPDFNKEKRVWNWQPGPWGHLRDLWSLPALRPHSHREAAVISGYWLTSFSTGLVSALTGDKTWTFKGWLAPDWFCLLVDEYIFSVSGLNLQTCIYDRNVHIKYVYMKMVHADESTKGQYGICLSLKLT